MNFFLFSSFIGREVNFVLGGNVGLLCLLHNDMTFLLYYSLQIHHAILHLNENQNMP